MLFLTSNVLVTNPKKTEVIFKRVANSAPRGLSVEQGKEKKTIKARRLKIGQLVSLRRFYASVYDNSNFPSHVASRFSWQRLTASTSHFLHAAINIRPPSVTSQPTPLPRSIYTVPALIRNTYFEQGPRGCKLNFLIHHFLLLAKNIAPISYFPRILFPAQ